MSKGKKTTASKPKPQKLVTNPEKPSTSLKMNEGRHKTAGEGVMVFGKMNYIIMGVGLVLIVLGFIVMATVPNLEMGAPTTGEEMFGFRAVVLPSFLIIIGLALQVVAILRKPKSGEAE
jgi:hypothetical protein